MSLSEKLFGAFHQWLKPKNSKYQASLAPLMPRLRILASALAEIPIEILPTRDRYGETRERSLILPNHIDVFESIELNEQVYLCRAAFSAILICQSTEELSGLMRNFQKLDELATNLSISKDDWMRLSRGTLPRKEEALFEDPAPLTLDSVFSHKKAQKLPSGKPSLAKVRSLDVSNTNPAVHVFEKLITAEDYKGGQRQIDSDADESDTSGALSELDMNQVVRATGETGSTYNAQLVIDGGCSESQQTNNRTDAERCFQYAEWSRKQARFLPGWCTIYEKTAQSLVGQIPPPLTLHLLKESRILKRKLEILINKPVWVRGQPDGSEFDLEAVIRWKSDLKAGNCIPKSLFMERQRLEQDIAVLILADTSLSTDAWIANKRVLDTIQESLSILAETLRDLNHLVSIAAFSSNTRTECVYLRIKDFSDSWELVPARIHALKPQGYTRMGPAIRHATHLIDKIRARKKLLLVISDSKPTDYDAYEGTHGESDVHHAVLEARICNITVKGLAVSDSDSGLAKRLYGRGGFETFTDARGLSERIVRAYCSALGL